MANLRETFTRRLTAAGLPDKRFFDRDHEDEKLRAVEAIHAREREVSEADARITAQQATLATLEKAALSAAANSGDWNTADDAVQSAQKELRRLTAERTVAGKRLEDARLHLHQITIADRQKKIEREGNQRLAAARDFETALSQGVDAMERLYRSTARMDVLIPANVRSGQYSRAWLFKITKAEIYRQSANPPLGGSVKRPRLAPTLPAGEPPSIDTIHATDRITPLSVEIERANKGLLDALATPPGAKPAAPVAPAPAVKEERVFDPVTGVEVISGGHLAVKKS